MASQSVDDTSVKNKEGDFFHKWIPEPNTVAGFLAGVAFATLFNQRGTVFFEGLSIGIILVIIGFCIAILQTPNETIDQVGIQSVSLSQAIFHEGIVDANSISALLSKTKILEKQDETSDSSKKTYDVMGGSVPLGFLDGDAILGKTTLDEAEIAFQKFKERAKDRLRILKSMNTWLKDFAEVERTHSKALDKLALLATTTIVNKLNESETDDAPLPTTQASSYDGILPKVPSRNPHLLPTSSGRADEPRYYDDDRPSLLGPSPLQHWWRSLASHMRHRAKESLAISKLSSDVMKQSDNRVVDSNHDLLSAVVRLQAEQSLLEKKCSAQGTILCKELRDAMIAKNSTDREHARAEDRLRVHVEHVSHNVQDKATGQLVRVASTPIMDKEGAKLTKAAAEAHAKRNEVSLAAQKVRKRFEDKMPIILHDFALLDHSLQVQSQAALLRFASKAKDVMIPTLKVLDK